MRELDFARFHFYVKTGLYDVIKKAKAHALQTATNIRYRRTMPLFTTYKITTKVRHPARLSRGNPSVADRLLGREDDVPGAAVRQPERRLRPRRRLQQAERDRTELLRGRRRDAGKGSVLQAASVARTGALVELHGEVQREAQEKGRLRG